MKSNDLSNPLQNWHLDPHLHIQIFIHLKIFIVVLLCAKHHTKYWRSDRKPLLFQSSQSRRGEGKITILSRKCWALGGWYRGQVKSTDSLEREVLFTQAKKAGLWSCVCGRVGGRGGQEQQNRTQEVWDKEFLSIRMIYRKIMKINMVECDVWIIKGEIRCKKLVFLMISLKNLSSKPNYVIWSN